MAEPRKGSFGALLQRYTRSWQKRGNGMRTALAVSPCSGWLYVAEGEAVHRLKLPLPAQRSATAATSWWPAFGRDDAVHALAASPDGRFLYVANCGDTKLQAASAESMTAVGNDVALPAFMPRTLVLAVSPDSATLYCCTDATLYLLDTPSGGAELALRRRVALPSGRAVAFSVCPAGDWLALAMEGSERVQIWSADTCLPVEGAEVPQGGVGALAWVGKRLVATSATGQVCLWQRAAKATPGGFWELFAREQGVPCDAIAVAPNTDPRARPDYGDAVLLYGRGGAASMWHVPCVGFLMGIPFDGPVKLPPLHCPNMCAGVVVGGREPAAILTEGHCEASALIVRCAALRPATED